MTNTNQFNFTTSYPGGQQLEVERGWSRPEIKEKLCSRGDKRQEHFEEEKK